MDTLGSRIKKTREKNGFTSQKAFAEKVGISNVVLSRYESGDRKPDYEILKKISDLLEVSINYLVTGKASEEVEITEFEKWKNNPKLDLFFQEFDQAEEEKQAALLAVWEIMKKQNNTK